MLFQLDQNKLEFPHPSYADEDGLLAIGGDLSVERLLLAYANGIFPWFNEETPILWYSPQERFVIFPAQLKISKSTQQILNKKSFQITIDENFPSVIQHCASITRKDQDGTWITTDMIAAYTDLFNKGFAHSVEVWQDKKLVGGLYGVLINGVFCGESMFSLVPNASKIALIYLAKNSNIKLIDCQFHTPHLASMGGTFLSLEAYLDLLQSDEHDKSL